MNKVLFLANKFRQLAVKQQFQRTACFDSLLATGRQISAAWTAFSKQIQVDHLSGGEGLYFKELVRYIHLNPLRAGLVADRGIGRNRGRVLVY